MDPRQRYYLQQMGIDVWLPRDMDELDAAAAPPEALAVAAEARIAHDAPAADLWPGLRQEVATCTACALHEGRTQTVFGVGDVQADWLLIGEAPGAEEDRRGEPFVGRAGKLLDAMLLAIGLAREQVFIANILKCRPPSNRDPKPEEVAACASFLKRQIALIEPKIIVALGRVAAQNLLGVDTPIGRMRGRQYEYGERGIPLVVSYHPAYLLRAPREKRKSWQDLQLAMRVYKASL